MKEKEKTVALYARVGLPDGQDTESQLSVLREYARKRNWTICREYVDRGIFGQRDGRPALDTLVKDALKREFDVVLVWRLDRFARSTRHLISSLEMFQAVKLDFASYQEDIDTSAPAGKAILNVLSAVGEMEARIIRERVKMGLRRVVKEGKKLGRPETRIDLDTAKKLQKEGKSIRQIAAELKVHPATLHRKLKAIS